MWVFLKDYEYKSIERERGVKVRSVYESTGQRKDRITEKTCKRKYGGLIKRRREGS